MNFSSFFDYPTEDQTEQMPAFVFLPKWTQRDWAKLLERTETYRFHAGSYVVRQGEQNRAFFIVTVGQFESLITVGGETRRLHLVESGAVMGEQVFFDNQPHPTDIRAVTEGEVIRLNYDAFEVFSAREPEMACDIVFDLGRIVSLRLRHLQITG